MTNFSPEYIRYIRSIEWQAKRRAALKRAGYRCQARFLFWRCNERHSLECHHKTYARLGNERPSDLLVLCARHHWLITQFTRALRWMTK